MFFKDKKYMTKHDLYNSLYLFGVKYWNISIEYILPYTMYYVYNIYIQYIYSLLVEVYI